MFHRKAAPFVVTTATNNSNGSSSNGTKIPPRRRTKVSSSLFSSKKISRKEWMITICATFVVTILIVAVMLRFFSYAFLYDKMTHHSINKLSPKQLQQQKHRHIVHHEESNEEEGGGGGGDDDESTMPYNELYRIPNSMKNVGDRSDRYVQLRMEMDAHLPVQQYDRSLLFVQQLLKNNPYVHHVSGNIKPASQEDAEPEEEEVVVDEESSETGGGIKEPKVMIHNSDQVNNPTYDIYNCPETPPEGYPYTWNMLQILNNWKPDNTTRPDSNIIYHSLCVFDYNDDYDTALTYRNAELPFIVINDPAVAETVERWNTPNYLVRLMGSAQHRTEYSENNHFMYFVPPPKNKKLRQKRQKQNMLPPNWKAPTKLIRMSYMEWLKHANVSDDLLGPDHPHWYYRLIGCGMTGNDGSCDTESSEYLFDELTFFQPRKNNNKEEQSSLYIVDPAEQKGIHCRFGMKGVIAENHFDGSRNAIVVLGGSRRYILSHPNQCEHLALYPKGHPSARHSAVDWNDPNLEEYPQFSKARGNEVVLTAGQVLYLPTEWFHFIVSLELNFQCNTRSGITKHYQHYIHQCGF